MSNWKATNGNVLVKINSKQKEKYALTENVVITWERSFNFNRREDYPSRAEVIDGENLPVGAEILVHHNATEPTFQVFNEEILTSQEKEEGYKILSIPMDMCFVFRENGEWKPCQDFLITQRIFKPYKGKLVLEHEQIKNRLYIVKGSIKDAPELEGKVCIVESNSDYEIIFHTKQNREERLIRTRSREIIAVDDKMTQEVNKGKYLIGLSALTAKTKT